MSTFVWFDLGVFSILLQDPWIPLWRTSSHERIPQQGCPKHPLQVLACSIDFTFVISSSFNLPYQYHCFSSPFFVFFFFWFFFFFFNCCLGIIVTFPPVTFPFFEPDLRYWFPEINFKKVSPPNLLQIRVGESYPSVCDTLPNFLLREIKLLFSPPCTL